MTNDLARALVHDYVDLGLAEGLSPTSLRSLDGENSVELAPLSSETGETVGLEVFVNGDSVTQLIYEDKEFNQKLVNSLAEPLNF